MTGNNIMQKTTDRRARKYTITLNNPLDMNPPMTHEQIKKSIGELCSVTYWCMADEVGVKEQTPHTHIYLYSVSPIRFSTIKRRFNQGHIESAYGSSTENRDYILKAGKWKNTAKTEIIFRKVVWLSGSRKDPADPKSWTAFERRIQR